MTEPLQLAPHRSRKTSEHRPAERARYTRHTQLRRRHFRQVRRRNFDRDAMAAAVDNRATGLDADQFARIGDILAHLVERFVAGRIFDYRVRLRLARHRRTDQLEVQVLFHDRRGRGVLRGLVEDVALDDQVVVGPRPHPGYRIARTQSIPARRIHLKYCARRYRARTSPTRSPAPRSKQSSES